MFIFTKAVDSAVRFVCNEAEHLCGTDSRICVLHGAKSIRCSTTEPQLLQICDKFKEISPFFSKYCRYWIFVQLTDVSPAALIHFLWIESASRRKYIIKPSNISSRSTCTYFHVGADVGLHWSAMSQYYLTPESQIFTTKCYSQQTCTLFH